jgi:ABC-type Fe3+/spermidine/putrescine transport system ATPase subunit
VAASGVVERGVMSRPLVDVRLEAISTRTGPKPHLADVSLHVRYGELFTVLGPPHSGKTAVLRVVAGFLPHSGGRVLVDGEDIGGLPPRARGIGYVFHQGALWPHLTVEQHVAFGLAQLRIARDEIERRVQVVTHRLGLERERAARPGALTLDGQRRLALARALAVEPRVLLLDEPLAHLDPLTRKTLRLELARLHRDLAVTTICATRDAADAMALSDRIAVMADGRVLQIGDPETLYRRPVSRGVAEALGPANFLPVRVVELRELGVVVETARGDRVPVPGLGAFREGNRGLLVLRPETLSINEAAMARGPGIPGQVSLRVFEGARYLYEIDVGAGDTIRVELPAGELSVFRLGDRVRVEISRDTAILLPHEDTPRAPSSVS